MLNKPSAPHHPPNDEETEHMVNKGHNADQTSSKYTRETNRRNETSQMQLLKPNFPLSLSTNDLDDAAAVVVEDNTQD